MTEEQLKEQLQVLLTHIAPELKGANFTGMSMPYARTEFNPIRFIASRGALHLNFLKNGAPMGYLLQIHLKDTIENAPGLPVLLLQSAVPAIECGATFWTKGESFLLEKIRIGFTQFEGELAAVYWLCLEFSNHFRLMAERCSPPAEGFNLIWEGPEENSVLERIDDWECQEVSFD